MLPVGVPDAAVQLAQMTISSSFSIKLLFWWLFVGWVFFGGAGGEVHPAFGVGKGCANWVPAGGDRWVWTVAD